MTEATKPSDSIDSPDNAPAVSESPLDNVSAVPSAEEPQKAPQPIEEGAAPPADPTSSDDDADITLEDLLSDPVIARELKSRQSALLANARKSWEAEAAKEKERAEMALTERLQAELADEKARADEASQRIVAIERDKEFSDALLKAGVQLVDANAVDYVRSLAMRMAETEDLSMSACITDVLEKNSYLLKKESVSQVTRPEARTTPQLPEKQTEAPSQPEPTKVVDTRKMSRQEYQEYKRTTHGIH